MRSNRSREGGCNHIPSFMDIGRGMCIDLSLVMGISRGGDNDTIITIYFTTGTTMIFEWRTQLGVSIFNKCMEIQDKLLEHQHKLRREDDNNKKKKRGNR